MLFLSKASCFLTILGTFLLLLKSGTPQSDSVFQSPSQMEIKEGESVSLYCNFSSSYSASPDLYWYRQHRGRGPQLIFHAYKNPQMKNQFAAGKFSTTLFLENKTVPLTIKGASLQEQAVFFCALRSSSNWKVTFGSGTRLIVTPNLKTSEPSIYKLQPSKEGDRDISACLITDYFPAPITVGADINNSEKVNGSVVVVKENGKETPSYGTVVWGKGKKAGDCYAEYKNRRFQPELAEAATTCSEKTTGSFETDERLNLLSLTVLGLRVIFLKCVAFNLLFTFHAWSS